MREKSGVTVWLETGRKLHRRIGRKEASLKDFDSCLAFQIEVVKRAAQIEETDKRLILLWRYVLGMEWKEIEITSGYSRVQLNRHRLQAIAALEKQIDNGVFPAV